MANRFAIADGDFGSTSTWSSTAGGSSGASVPTTGDSAMSNGHIVQITANVTCTDLRNDTQGSATIGGYFNCATAGVTITANVVGAATNLTNLGTLTVANATGTVTLAGNVTGVGTSANQVACYFSGAGTLAINGNVTQSATFFSSSASNALFVNSSGGTVNITGNVSCLATAGGPVVSNGSTATVNITGSVSSATSGNSNSAHAIVNTSTGALNVTGNVTGTLGTGGGGSGNGILASGTGTITIVGNVTGGANTQGEGLRVTGNATVSITGTVTGGTGLVATLPYGVSNSGTGTVTISGTLQAGTNVPAVFAVNAGATPAGPVVITGPLKCSAGGITAIVATKWLWSGTPPAATYMDVRRNDTLALYSLYTADSVGGNPAVTDVRRGTVYGPVSSQITGTAYIPGASSVAAGVNVDATVGTAVITVAALMAAALPSAPTANTLGEALFIADNLVGRINTAAGGAASSITFDAGASSTDGRYVGYRVFLYGGTGGGIRGVGQERSITAYNGTTKVATVAQPWGTNPDNTTTFMLYVEPWANVGSWNGTPVTTPNTAGTPVVDATRWAGGTIPAPNVTGVPLIDLKYTLGTISPATAGTVRADAVTGLTASDVGAIKAKTDNLPAAPASTTNITAASGVALAAAYDAAKTASQAGDAMALTSGERTSTATAVWASASRSLTTFGTLVADVATAVWSAVSRTITGTVTLDATQGSYAPAKAGDAMTLTGAYDAAKTAASQSSVNAIPTTPLLAADYTAPDNATIANNNAGILAIFNNIGTPADTVSADIAAISTATTAIGIRTAVGLSNPDLDQQLAAKPSLVDILRTAMTEGYAMAGSAPTLEQFLFMIEAQLRSRVLTGTAPAVLTSHKLDGVTDAMTFSVDDTTSPSVQERVS